LALNRSKTSSTENRKSTQYQEFVEELVNLLFCIEDEDFSDKITQKLYSKYKYQSVSKRSKSIKKKIFLKIIEEISTQSYTQILTQK